MNLDEVTPLVLTWNEAPNLRRCLERLRWASRVVVVDSGSDDGTLGICEEFPNVETVTRPFDNHTDQWNHGLSQVATRWVLALDADYILDTDFADELLSLEPEDKVAWFADFRYLVHGRALRGSLYPPRAVLFDRSACRYVADGHTQRLEFAGPSGRLAAKIDHDDRKPLGRWLDSQSKYARLEADKLATESGPGTLPDRLRRMVWPAAPAVFLFTLLAKRAILDGWPGWFYALQRTYAELLLSLILLERRFRT